MRSFQINRRLCQILAALFFLTSLCSSVQGAMISSSEMINAQSTLQQRNELLNVLAQQEAIDALIALGVDRETVEQRVQQMTVEELQAFQQQVDSMQAGGSSVIGVILVVFFILVVLDLLGTTNIFPVIKPIQVN